MSLTLRWGEIVTGEEEECLSWKKATEKSGARAHPCECTGGVVLGRKQQFRKSEISEWKSWPGRNCDSLEGHA